MGAVFFFRLLVCRDAYLFSLSFPSPLPLVCREMWWWFIACGRTLASCSVFLALCHDKVFFFSLSQQCWTYCRFIFACFMSVEESWKRWFIINSHSVCKEALIIPHHCYSATESDRKMGKKYGTAFCYSVLLKTKKEIATMTSCFFLCVMCMSLCVPWFLFTSEHSPEKKNACSCFKHVLESVCIIVV